MAAAPHMPPHATHYSRKVNTKGCHQSVDVRPDAFEHRTHLAPTGNACACRSGTGHEPSVPVSRSLQSRLPSSSPHRKFACSPAPSMCTRTQHPTTVCALSGETTWARNHTPPRAGLQRPDQTQCHDMTPQARPPAVWARSAHSQPHNTCTQGVTHVMGTLSIAAHSRF